MLIWDPAQIGLIGTCGDVEILICRWNSGSQIDVKDMDVLKKIQVVILNVFWSEAPG